MSVCWVSCQPVAFSTAAGSDPDRHCEWWWPPTCTRNPSPGAMTAEGVCGREGSADSRTHPGKEAGRMASWATAQPGVSVTRVLFSPSACVEPQGRVWFVPRPSRHWARFQQLHVDTAGPDSLVLRPPGPRGSPLHYPASPGFCPPVCTSPDPILDPLQREEAASWKDRSPLLVAVTTAPSASASDLETAPSV